jgi:hypothetical protein
MRSLPQPTQWERFEDLVLVRLLAAGKPTTTLLDRDLKRYVTESVALSAAEWHQMLERTLSGLEADERVTLGPIQLTDKGRTSARHLLSTDSQLVGIKWQTLRNRYLMATVLGVAPQTKTQWERLGTADGLRAALLAKHYQLRVDRVPTPAQVLDALAWLQLKTAHKFESPFEKQFTRNAVLRETLLGGRTCKDPVSVLAARAIRATSSHVEKLRESLIGTWVRGDTSSPVDRQLFDLRAFAASVTDLARTASSGRFGDHKVFISHVWHRFCKERGAESMTREEFNQHLVDANREALLTLSRADLVSAMTPEDVQRSEIKLPNHSFHFIRTDGQAV